MIPLNCSKSRSSHLVGLVENDPGFDDDVDDEAEGVNESGTVG
jgi:hypothetical protein